MNSVSQSIEHESYFVEDVSQIHSPGLLIYLDYVKANLDEMIRIAGSPDKLCPHCKTHKTREIAKLMLERGIHNQKAATIAEAEMLASSGVPNILIAYQMVGPNINRLSQLIDKFPASRFATLIDNPHALDSLSATMHEKDQQVDVLIDLEAGMQRTGIEPGAEAIELIEMAMTSPGITLDGLHWYDGHNRSPENAERIGVAVADWRKLQSFKDQLLLSGIPINRVVAAGIGSFPVLAETASMNLQLSPGTPTYFDADMQERFPDMNFQPAALILTRVISSNRPGHLTLDIGHKSCAADMPAGNRLRFPCIPDAQEVLQSEEHCVIKTSLADQFSIGSATVAIPRHACPVSAVHRFGDVIAQGKIVDRWEMVGRDRTLTI